MSKSGTTANRSAGPLEAALPETIRVAARERFETLEWPTPDLEEWRRTDVTRFPFDAYIPYLNARASSCGGVRTRERSFEAGELSGRIEFRDGSLEDVSIGESLSSSGVAVSILREEGTHVRTHVNGRLEAMVRETISRAENRVEVLPFRERIHGVVLRIPRGVRLEHPILVEFIEGGAGALANPQLYVAVEPGAAATVIRSIRSGDDDLLCNPRDIVSVGENAELDIVTLVDIGAQTSLFEFVEASVAANGRIRRSAVYLGGSLVKSRSTINLDGEAGEASLCGALFASHQAHLDIKTVQRHAAPYTKSRTFYKSAVRDSGRTVYQGLIEVDDRAVKTDAYLSNQNIVLNDGARADSIPSLAIRTNDVRCSHGSTTGRIDENQLFYLMSRGIPRADAERAILEGYFEDCLKLVLPDVRKPLMGEIIQRLRSGTETTDTETDKGHASGDAGGR